MSDFDRRTCNLRALNSMTKYPSIPTYHQLDPRTGSLMDGVVAFDSTVIGTEKVDGTNARIIMLPDGGYLLGSREELLYANGDLIGNPAQGIAEHLRPVADWLPGFESAYPTVRVYYVELYGGKIGGQAKNYSTKGAVGWRLFDVAEIADYAEVLSWDSQRISTWRDAGGQPFAAEDRLAYLAAATQLELAPRLFTAAAVDVPTGIAQMRDFLAMHLPDTRVALDDSGKGRPEGIVLRSPDRTAIAKARFQDYDRTLKRRGPL